MNLLVHNRDIDRVILLQLDLRTATRFGAVNKEGQTLVSDLFFRNYFQAHYSHLSSDSIFCRLGVYFPNIYWKVACYTLTHGLSPSVGYVEEHRKEVWLCLHNRVEVLKETPEMCGIEQKIFAAISDKEVYHQQFCTFDAQLNAAIYNGENTLNSELNHACQELRKTYRSLSELKEMFRRLRTDLLCMNNPLELNESFFQKLIESDGEPFYSSLILHYLVLGTNIQRSHHLLEQLNAKEAECHQLQLIWNEFLWFQEISHFLKDKDLKKEAVEGICEDILEEKDCTIAKECRAKIALYQKDPSNNALRLHIRSLVNFHSQSKLIWNSLYNYRAHQSPDVQWIENHFHEFLEDLSNLLNEPSKWELVLDRQFFDQNAYIDFIFYLGEVLNTQCADSDERVQEEIQAYVNSITGGDKIWKALYERCANNDQEGGWAQRHVIEFLPEFYGIIQSVKLV